jgi:hypothetical protein
MPRNIHNARPRPRRGAFGIGIGQHEFTEDTPVSNARIKAERREQHARDVAAKAHRAEARTAAEEPGSLAGRIGAVAVAVEMAPSEVITVPEAAEHDESQIVLDALRGPGTRRTIRRVRVERTVGAAVMPGLVSPPGIEVADSVVSVAGGPLEVVGADPGIIISPQGLGMTVAAQQESA